MSKNDDRILELKKQIEAKKKSISEKKITVSCEIRGGEKWIRSYVKQRALVVVNGFVDIM